MRLLQVSISSILILVNFLVGNYSFLLKLADFYQVISVIEKCDTFLKDDDSVPFAEKVFMIDKYGLSETKKTCLSSSEFQDRSFISGLMRKPEYKKISAELKVELLEKSINSFTLKLFCSHNHHPAGFTRTYKCEHCKSVVKGSI